MRHWAVDLFPQHSLALCRLGQALFAKNDQLESALDCFERARAVDPCLPDASLFGGFCLRRLQRVEEACE